MVAPLTPPQPNNLWDFITVEGRVRRAKRPTQA